MVFGLYYMLRQGIVDQIDENAPVGSCVESYSVKDKGAKTAKSGRSVSDLAPDAPREHLSMDLADQRQSLARRWSDFEECARYERRGGEVMNLLDNES